MRSELTSGNQALDNANSLFCRRREFTQTCTSGPFSSSTYSTRSISVGCGRHQSAARAAPETATVWPTNRPPTRAFAQSQLCATCTHCAAAPSSAPFARPRCGRRVLTFSGGLGGPEEGGERIAGIDVALVGPEVPDRLLQRGVHHAGMRRCEPSQQPASATLVHPTIFGIILLYMFLRHLFHGAAMT